MRRDTLNLLVAALVAFALLAAACGGDDDGPVTLDEIQGLSSNNSYHQRPVPEALERLTALSPELAAETNHGHEPIARRSP